MLRAGRAGDFAPEALRSAQRRVCGGCGGAFTPTRKHQRHCRGSCRALASRNRRDRAQPELFHGAGLYQPE
jgi:hypothetical protein